MNTLKYKLPWKEHDIVAESKMYGGWPGVGLLGGSIDHSISVDGKQVAFHHGSQAGSLFDGIRGKKMELNGTFSDADGTQHTIHIWFPWSTPYCVITIDHNDPINTPVTYH